MTTDRSNHDPSEPVAEIVSGLRGAVARLRFSIVIPTYNRRERVLRAIDHVLAQNGEGHVQIVVVDDGSNDATGAAIAERYPGHADIEVVVTANRGPSAARNVGLERVRGDFVCFLDSDDWFLPDTMGVVAQVFARWPELNFVTVEGRREPMKTHPNMVENTGGIVRPDCPGWGSPGLRQAHLRSESMRVRVSAGDAEFAVIMGDMFPAIIYGDMFYLSGLFIRTEVARAAGKFVERYWLFEDWDYHARLCMQGTGAYVSYIGFCRETGSGDQLSRRLSMQRNAGMHLRILRSLANQPGLAKRNDYQRHVRKARADAHYWLGRCLLGGDNPKPHAARRLLFAAMSKGHKPLKSAYLIAMSYLRGAHAVQ